jgi:hypothetical protein
MRTTKTTEPGRGAVEFAKEFTEGLTKEEALPVIRRLIRGELHDHDDKRIKKCEYCGYYYRDKTRPNNSKTCSPECKAARDYLAKAKKRADAALLKPKKPKYGGLYAYWLEYPYWTDEKAMLRYNYRREAVFDDQKLAQIDAARQRAERIGGRRKPKYVASDEKQYNVRVKFAKYEEARKPGPVKTYYLATDKTDISGNEGDKPGIF